MSHQVGGGLRNVITCDKDWRGVKKNHDISVTWMTPK